MAARATLSITFLREGIFVHPFVSRTTPYIRYGRPENMKTRHCYQLEYQVIRCGIAVRKSGSGRFGFELQLRDSDDQACKPNLVPLSRKSDTNEVSLLILRKEEIHKHRLLMRGCILNALSYLQLQISTFICAMGK